MENYKNIKKLNLMELRESLDRINALLCKSNIINNLPDKGIHIREAKEKFEKEIVFRQNLNLTSKLLTNLSLDSEQQLPHSTKICLIEKSPQKERFKLNVGVKPNDSEHKVKLIDLQTSLDLQIQQQDRLRAEQKSNLLSKLLNESTEEDSDEESGNYSSTETEVDNETKSKDDGT